MSFRRESLYSLGPPDSDRAEQRKAPFGGFSDSRREKADSHLSSLFSLLFLPFFEQTLSPTATLTGASSLVRFGPIGEGGGEKSGKRRDDLFSPWVKIFGGFGFARVWSVFALDAETL